MDQPRSLRAARMPSSFIVESELLLPLVAGSLLPVLGDVALLSGAVVVLGVVLVEPLGDVDVASDGLALMLGDDCGVVVCDGVVDGVALELSVVDCA